MRRRRRSTTRSRRPASAPSWRRLTRRPGAPSWRMKGSRSARTPPRMRRWPGAPRPTCPSGHEARVVPGVARTWTGASRSTRWPIPCGTHNPGRGSTRPGYPRDCRRPRLHLRLHDGAATMSAAPRPSRRSKRARVRGAGGGDGPPKLAAQPHDIRLGRADRSAFQMANSPQDQRAAHTPTIPAKQFIAEAYESVTAGSR
jgi:hypothetical protein